MKYLVACLVLLLSGCTSWKEMPDGTLVGNVEVQVDKRLLRECKDFNPIKENPNAEDVIAQHGDDVVVHADCKNNNSALVKVMKEAFK